MTPPLPPLVAEKCSGPIWFHNDTKIVLLPSDLWGLVAAGDGLPMLCPFLRCQAHQWHCGESSAPAQTTSFISDPLAMVNASALQPYEALTASKAVYPAIPVYVVCFCLQPQCSACVFFHAQRSHCAQLFFFSGRIRQSCRARDAFV